MTREQARQELERDEMRLEAKRAYANGECIQFKNASELWRDLEDPEFDSSSGAYRVKPKPKFRPWKLEEIPVGALYRLRGGEPGVILSRGRGEVVSRVYYTFEGIIRWDTTQEALLLGREHSIDGGKTWRPCGVLETDV